MTNEEMKVKYESLNSVDDAYNLLKEHGYTGTMENFIDLCARAADDMALNMDDMDQVAGGASLMDTVETGWNKTKEVFGKTLDWIQKNPGTAVEIVGGTAAAIIGITYVVKRNGANNSAPENIDYGHRPSMVSNASSHSSDESADSSVSFDLMNKY